MIIINIHSLKCSNLNASIHKILAMVTNDDCDLSDVTLMTLY